MSTAGVAAGGVTGHGEPVEIRFCEKCGRRVSEGELEGGGAVARGELVWCAACAEQAPAARGPAFSRARAEPDATRAASARGAGGTRPPRPGGAREAPAAGSARSRALTFAAMLACGMGAVLAVFFLFASGKEARRGPAHVPEGDAPVVEAAHADLGPAGPAPPPVTGPPLPPEDPASGAADPVEPAAAADEPAQAASGQPAPGPKVEDDFGPAFFARTAFERAEAYSRERPGDLAGRLERYRPIARLYTTTAPDVARRAEERMKDIAALLAEKGIVTNGGFEQGPAGWKIPGDGMGSVTTTQAATGRSSLRIVDADGTKGSNVCSARCPVAVEGTYEIRGKVFPVSGSGVGVYVRMYDAGGRQLNEKDARGSIQALLSLGGSDREWKPFAKRFQTRPGTVKLEIWIHSFNASRVEAYLDDLDIVAVQE